MLGSALSVEVKAEKVRMIPEELCHRAVGELGPPDRMVQVSQHQGAAVLENGVGHSPFWRIDGKHVHSGIDDTLHHGVRQFLAEILRHVAHIEGHHHGFEFASIDFREKFIGEGASDFRHVVVDEAGIRDGSLVAGLAGGILVNAENGVGGFPFMDVGRVVDEGVPGAAGDLFRIDFCRGETQPVAVRAGFHVQKAETVGQGEGEFILFDRLSGGRVKAQVDRFDGIQRKVPDADRRVDAAEESVVTLVPEHNLPQIDISGRKLVRERFPRKVVERGRSPVPGSGNGIGPARIQFRKFRGLDFEGSVGSGFRGNGENGHPFLDGEAVASVRDGDQFPVDEEFEVGKIFLCKVEFKDAPGHTDGRDHSEPFIVDGFVFGFRKACVGFRDFLLKFADLVESGRERTTGFDFLPGFAAPSDVQQSQIQKLIVRLVDFRAFEFDIRRTVGTLFCQDRKIGRIVESARDSCPALMFVGGIAGNVPGDVELHAVHILRAQKAEGDRHFKDPAVRGASGGDFPVDRRFGFAFGILISRPAGAVGVGQELHVTGSVLREEEHLDGIVEGPAVAVGFDRPD
ncbi:MAG: hypothetical protein DDT32_01181 [Syntrophomonadaceae bacterium]|nr:hypothetical protein [Bacillota bacterium]